MGWIMNMENKDYLVKLINYEIGYNGEFYEKDYVEVVVNSSSEEEAMKKMEQMMLTDPMYKYLYEGGFIIKSVEEDEIDDIGEGFYHV